MCLGLKSETTTTKPTKPPFKILNVPTYSHLFASIWMKSEALGFSEPNTNWRDHLNREYGKTINLFFDNNKIYIGVNFNAPELTLEEFFALEPTPAKITLPLNRTSHNIEITREHIKVGCKTFSHGVVKQLQEMKSIANIEPSILVNVPTDNSHLIRAVLAQFDKIVPGHRIKFEHIKPDKSNLISFRFLDGDEGLVSFAHGNDWYAHQYAEHKRITLDEFFKIKPTASLIVENTTFMFDGTNYRVEEHNITFSKDKLTEIEQAIKEVTK